MLSDDHDTHREMPTPDCLLVQVTCPQGNAEQLAKMLVEARFAACVNIVPRVRSIYRWGETVNSDFESLLLIKTARHAYAELRQMIVDLHPYEVPEVIVIDISDGLPSYLSWLHASLPSGERRRNGSD